MTVIIFIILLAVLVFVHELGHFLIAKKFGIRVDEFGIGFPPRLWSFKRGETVYSFNLIPFGGFVKIFGENPQEENIEENITEETITIEERHRNLSFKARPIQGAVLAGGILFNIIFAWLLISVGFMFGMPTSTSSALREKIENPKLIVAGVYPNSPASEAGLKFGDHVLSIRSESGKIFEGGSAEDGTAFIMEESNGKLYISYERSGENKIAEVTPALGIIKDRRAIGITMDEIGTLKLPIHKAFIEGGIATARLTRIITVDLGTFIKDAFTGNADLAQITGPIGIAGLVGEARDMGIAYLISFAAFISLNLAIINLIPFPALDGGRLLFLAIEGIKRSPINPKVANALNGAGFALLILLMLVITYNDVIRLF